MKEGNEGTCQECFSGTLQFATDKKVNNATFDIYTCDNCGVHFVVKSIDNLVPDEWYDPSSLESLLDKLQ